MAVSVYDPDAAALDTPDLPRRVAQQEHVSGHALDGEVLVDGANEGLLRVGNDVVVSRVRNRAAAGHGGYSGSTSTLEPAVYSVPMEESAVASQPGSESLREHLHHTVVL